MQGRENLAALAGKIRIHLKVSKSLQKQKVWGTKITFYSCRAWIRKWESFNPFARWSSFCFIIWIFPRRLVRLIRLFRFGTNDLDRKFVKIVFTNFFSSHFFSSFLLLFISPTWKYWRKYSINSGQKSASRMNGYIHVCMYKTLISKKKTLD